MRIKLHKKDVADIRNAGWCAMTILIKIVLNGMIEFIQKGLYKKAKRTYGDFWEQYMVTNTVQGQLENFDEYRGMTSKVNPLKDIRINFGGIIGNIRLLSAARCGSIWSKLEIIACYFIFKLERENRLIHPITSRIVLIKYYTQTGICKAIWRTFLTLPYMLNIFYVYMFKFRSTAKAVKTYTQTKMEMAGSFVRGRIQELRMVMVHEVNNEKRSK